VSSSPTADVNAIMRRSQTRVSKSLEVEQMFIISVADTQDILGKAAKSKMNFVILNVDLVASTKLSMTLPLDRLTIMIQAFNQEMSLIVKRIWRICSKIYRRRGSCIFPCSKSSISIRSSMYTCNKLRKVHASGGPRRD
jgi:hypothetical protein